MSVTKTSKASKTVAKKVATAKKPTKRIRKRFGKSTW